MVATLVGAVMSTIVDRGPPESSYGFGGRLLTMKNAVVAAWEVEDHQINVIVTGVR